jgi:hypothetical protein
MESGCNCAVSAWAAGVKPNPASIGASVVKAGGFVLARLMLPGKFYQGSFPSQAVIGLTSGSVVNSVPLFALKG